MDLEWSLVVSAKYLLPIREKTINKYGIPCLMFRVEWFENAVQGRPQACARCAAAQGHQFKGAAKFWIV